MDGIKLYLAPMAGITDAAMRELCVEQGAQITFTEMISAKGIAYRNMRTEALMQLSAKETWAGVQLFGKEPDLLANTAREVCDRLGDRLYVIDINMGCPAPKIVNNGEGSALMKNLPLAYQIIHAVKRAVPVRVSVKFRKGFDENSVNAVAFAKMAEEAGADAVTVHGRTRRQYYSGQADWDIIRAVKDAVSIEVIGNGDIFLAEDAVRMMRETGCDAVMIARGAQGNPFLFAQAAELMRYGEVRTHPTDAQRVEACIRQARLAVANKGEYIAVREMRTHAPHYTKGMQNSAKIRAELVKIETIAQLEEILYGFVKKTLLF